MIVPDNCYMEVLHRGFRFSGHTFGFHPLSERSEPHSKANSATLGCASKQHLNGTLGFDLLNQTLGPIYMVSDIQDKTPSPPPPT